MLDRSTRWFFPILGLVLLLLAWQVGSWVIRATSERPNEIWPGLEYVFGTSFPNIGVVGKRGVLDEGGRVLSGEEVESGIEGNYADAINVLLRESGNTVRRVVVGASAGAALGILVGLLVGLTRLPRRAVYPAINYLRQIPLLALAIMFLLWFGGAEKSIYIFVMFGVSTMLMINTMNAVRNIPEVQVRYARTLGSGRARVVRSVIVPGIVPELVGGLKVAIGLAWAMVLGAEYLQAQDTGLGRLMLFFEAFGFVGRMAVILMLLVAYALISHSLLTMAGNRATRWVPRGVA